MKRKHASSTPSSSDASDESSGSSSTSHRAKRRRFSHLERTMSNLSLSNNNPNSSASTSRFRGNSSSSTPSISELGVPRDDIPMIQPTAVVEIPEVKMKSFSWYEPEPDRIVVTELESSDEEEEEDATSPVCISPVLLDRIRSQSLVSPIPNLETQQALVLYRPLPRPQVEEVEEDVEDKTDQGKDDDAMDVDEF